jgi:hypothetical protein
MIDSISLSEALPEEYEDLKEGDTFMITGLLIEDMGTPNKPWKRVRINAQAIPDGLQVLKYKTGAYKVVSKCESLLHKACFGDGRCRKPIRVKVIGYDGQNGRGLDLVDG